MGRDWWILTNPMFASQTKAYQRSKRLVDPNKPRCLPHTLKPSNVARDWWIQTNPDVCLTSLKPSNVARDWWIQTNPDVCLTSLKPSNVARDWWIQTNPDVCLTSLKPSNVARDWWIQTNPDVCLTSLKPSNVARDWWIQTNPDVCLTSLKPSNVARDWWIQTNPDVCLTSWSVAVTARDWRIQTKPSKQVMAYAHWRWDTECAWMKQIMFVYYITSLSLVGNLGHLTCIRHSSRMSSATHFYQCVQYFHVPKNNGKATSVWDFQHVHRCRCVWLHTGAVQTP